MKNPLASALRPSGFKDFFGQEKIIGENAWLRQSIERGNLPSLILWGPPGSGKTSLALIIAKEMGADLISFSATNSGLKDLREVVSRAEANSRLGSKTILFIDEVHRWNKSQQDSLLPSVEDGTLILIGATTENPSFSINQALLSRVKLIVLERLTEDDIIKIIKRGLSNLKIKLNKKTIEMIAQLSDGDARRALNVLEAAYFSGSKIDIGLIKDLFDKSRLHYDKKGDEHYNIISALHKSMRGGDPQASLYWLARMIEGGEDPLFIARRLIRFASEDIGLANNTALVLANSAHDACQKIGLPECNLALAQCVIYLAKSKKSVLVYKSYNMVLDEISESGSLPVPKHLRNAPTSLMKNLGHGKNYKYSPEEDDSDQSYLPSGLKNKKFKELKL
jgi:putative ATPase